MTRQLDRLGAMARKATADRVPRDPDERQRQFEHAWARLVEHPSAESHLGKHPPAKGIRLARRGELRYGGGVLEAESLWAILKAKE